MSKAAELAEKFLGDDEVGMDAVRIYEFKDDSESHDDEFIAKKYREFAKAFKNEKSSLTVIFGPPQVSATGGESIIPLNGILDYSIWDINGKTLYLCTAHEDRELPILMMVGTATKDHKTDKKRKSPQGILGKLRGLLSRKV